MNISSRTRHAFRRCAQNYHWGLAACCAVIGTLPPLRCLALQRARFHLAPLRASRSQANLPSALRARCGLRPAWLRKPTSANFTGDCRRLSPSDTVNWVAATATRSSLRDVTCKSAGVGCAPPESALPRSPGFPLAHHDLQAALPISTPAAGSPLRPPSSPAAPGGLYRLQQLRQPLQALPPGQYLTIWAHWLNYRIVGVRVVDGGRRRRCQQFPPITGRAAASCAATGMEPTIASYSGIHQPPNFTGAAMTLDNDIDNLRNVGFNDRIRSMRDVSAATGRPAKIVISGGSCMVFGPATTVCQLDRSISSLRRVGEPSWNEPGTGQRRLW